MAFLATAAFFAATVVSAASVNSVPRALTSPLGPVVDLGYAAYAGSTETPGVVFYGGIPYIKAPVGDLRFRAPQALDEKKTNTAGVVDARKWGSICIQQPAAVGFGSEDCVTLNVWTPPRSKKDSKLPVYVYIHGGGHYYNSAQGFPGAHAVAENGGHVVVSLQYRLGLLGFLAGSTVTKNNAGSVNNGIKDQRAGLQWIQRNIAAFGGDPTKVTIGGESSGAGSVVLHLTAFGGEKNPPYRAAVIQSAGNDPFYLPEKIESCFAAVTTYVGCNTRADVMACWRSTPIAKVIDAVNNKPSTCKFMPVVDGAGGLIPDLTTKLLSAKKFAQVPILAGHTAQDGSIFVGKPADVTTDAQVVAMVMKRYTLSTASQAKMLQVYPAPSASTPWKTQWERAMYAFQETEFACWDYWIPTLTGKKSYNYRFDGIDPNLVKSRGAYVGAAHTADLFYLYKGTNSGPSPNVPSAEFTPFSSSEAILAKQSVAWWSSFAKTLDPNTSAALGSPKWEPSSSGKFMVADVGGKSKMEAFSTSYPKRCEFWRSIANEIRL